jgi:hypothetical protein
MSSSNTSAFHTTVAAVLIGFALSSSAIAGSVSLSGGNAEGYFAIVGVNQDAGTLDAINRDPDDRKFLDYPAYVNPNDPSKIYLMSVEPYRFGLSYPDPWHPTGPGTFASVGTLQPAGTPGASFIDGVTEDADFHDFDIGTISYPDELVSGSGTEILGVSELTLILLCHLHASN